MLQRIPQSEVEFYRNYLPDIVQELRNVPFEPYSAKDPNYNCLSLAIKVTSLAIWPDTCVPSDYWPDFLEKIISTQAIVDLLTHLGFHEVDKVSDQSPQCVRIIIQTDSFGPTHVSIRYPGQAWHSKLGPEINIYHKQIIVGNSYGAVERCLEMNAFEYDQLSEDDVLGLLKLQRPTLDSEQLKLIEQMGAKFSQF